MKTKYIIIGLVIILLVLFFTQKKEHAGSTTPSAPQLSSEAIQNIAKVYADTNNTATFNNINTIGAITTTKLNIGNKNIIDTSGNINSDIISTNSINITGDISGNGAKKLIETARLNTFNNKKPIILSIAVGNAKLPIGDLNNNTFSSDEWLCRINSSSGGLVVGIRNNKWWVANYSWGAWQFADIEFTPINVSATNYYDSNSSFHPIITSDVVVPGTPSAWATGPVNTNNGSYYIYNKSTNSFVARTPPLS